jgi:lysophospholipase L1-like esterase
MKTFSLLLLSIFIIWAANALAQENPDPHRFDKEIQNFEKWDSKNSFPKGAILFVGSSSIRMWKTQESFPDLTLINRGFGGAHISDVIFFIEQTTLKYDAPIIFFYCGDNDIAGNKSPQQVLEDYKIFVQKVLENRSDTKIMFLAIKPSIARWGFWPEMDIANQLISQYSETNDHLFYVDTATPMLEMSSPPPADLFISDGLHLSDKGYQNWTDVILTELAEISTDKPAVPSAPKSLKKIE